MSGEDSVDGERMTHILRSEERHTYTLKTESHAVRITEESRREKLRLEITMTSRSEDNADGEK